MKKIASFVTAIAIACLVVAPALAASSAGHKPVRARANAYDGLWSVSIFTQFGPCDPSYRYPARIIRGRVQQVDNDFSYQLYGVVTGAGGISVTVSKAGQSATGYGRLNSSRGAGWWRAQGGQCSGTWTAMRRG
jgi:hypothetical protein